MGISGKGLTPPGKSSNPLLTLSIYRVLFPSLPPHVDPAFQVMGGPANWVSSFDWTFSGAIGGSRGSQHHGQRPLPRAPSLWGPDSSGLLSEGRIQRGDCIGSPPLDLCVFT